MSCGPHQSSGPEGSAFTLYDRVMESYLVPLVISHVEAITWVATDLSDESSSGSGSLDPGDVLFDQLQNPWPVDARGYNFRWSPPTSCIPEGGKTYQIDVQIEPVLGENITISFQHTTFATFID